MVVLIISLALGVVEFASCMAMYRLFLYEESIQEGNMAMYVFRRQNDGDSVQRVRLATEDHGIKPASQELDQYGWLVPWAVDSFSYFLWAAQMSVAAL
jgi:hypothetical protein